MRATGIGEEEPAFQDFLLLLEDDAETLTPVDNFTDTDAMETTGCSESDYSSSGIQSYCWHYCKSYRPRTNSFLVSSQGKTFCGLS